MQLLKLFSILLIFSIASFSFPSSTFCNEILLILCYFLWLYVLHWGALAEVQGILLKNHEAYIIIWSISIHNIRLISKFMTLQLCWETIANKQLRCAYCPISHEVKATTQWNLISSQNIKREIFFFTNHAENKASRLVQNLVLLLKKALNEGKASGLRLSFNIFW